MDKYKKLASNTIIFAIGSFGAKFLSFFLVRLYSKFIDTAGFGIKELIETTANFIIPVVTFCMADAIIRYGLKKTYSKKKIFTSAAIMMLVGLTGLALLSPLFNLLSFLDGYGFLLYLYIFCSCFRSLCSNFVRSQGYVKLFAADGIFATFMLLVFNIIFIAICKLGVTGFLISVILSDFVSGLTLTLVAGLWKYFSFKEIDKEMIKKMLKYSLPLVPTAIMWLITGFSDRLFLKYMDYSYQFTGDTATGIYSAASKIPNLIAMVSTIFFQAWNMSAIMESKSEDLENFYTNVYKAYQSVLYIAAAWLIALSIPLSAILLDYETDPLYRYCYRYTPILVVAVLMMCFSQFLSSVYNVTKKTRNSFFTSVISAVVNIILNIILIKRMGIQGAGIATLVSYLTCYIIRLIDCRKQIPFSTDMIKEALNFVVIILMCVVLIVLPVGWIDYLIAGTLYITVANFGAVIKTAKRFLERRHSA